MAGANAIRTLYLGSSGQAVSIRADNLLGSGGEGSIYALDELPDHVAKVYHNPGDAIRSKLELMVANPPTMPDTGGHVSITWPLDTLCEDPSRDTSSVVGYLMHRLSASRQLNQCFNPAARKRVASHYTYKHLCAIAINLAIVVDAVHGGNYVIGDINESNFLVDDNGFVTLIDTDSFQVIDRSDGTVHRSPVGKPEYTPPDLQGMAFRDTDRNQYHDRFGLGVLIFQLLLEGRHPYTGRYTGRGEPPATEDNIASGYFLHSESRAVPLVEGPGYLPFDTLDGSLQEIFRLCFDSGHDNGLVRPTPRQWEDAITASVQSLAQCSVNPNHLYFPHYSWCPWCERRDMLGGSDPFPAAAGPDALVMRRQGALTSPAPAPAPAPMSAPARTPQTPAPTRQRRRAPARRPQLTPSAQISWIRRHPIVVVAILAGMVIVAFLEATGFDIISRDSEPPIVPAAPPPLLSLLPPLSLSRFPWPKTRRRPLLHSHRPHPTRPCLHPLLPQLLSQPRRRFPSPCLYPRLRLPSPQPRRQLQHPPSLLPPQLHLLILRPRPQLQHSRLL